jgi:ATP-binding cassette subfamily B protein
LCGITREGVSFLDISYAAEKIGLRSLSVKATVDDLADKICQTVAHFFGV